MDTRLTPAFWTLRIAFGLMAFLAGLDKFLNLLTNWEQYASPLVLAVAPFSAGTLMRVAGVVEMAAGLAVLVGVTRLGGYVVAAWLSLIALTLVTTGRYFDIAVRDLVLACGAFVLARLSEVREETAVRRSRNTRLSAVAVVALVVAAAAVPATARAQEIDPHFGDLVACHDDPFDRPSRSGFASARRTLDEGRRIFRYDTFGDEAFWGETLRLHEAIAGSANGGVGGGVSPRTALAVGLKVDSEALPKTLVDALRAGKVNLDDPATTLALLKLDAVVGVAGRFSPDGRLNAVGIRCAFCHSTVDDSLAPGIGRRRDGWPNRDLNVGAIVSLSPDLSAVDRFLGVDDATTRAVLASWGPGKFDAALFLDGKAFRPDGKSAATLIPPAFGLAGVNAHTYTAWGSVPYWNAFVAVLEMHGKGSFYDPRLDDAVRFPVAARNRSGHVEVSPEEDQVTSKLGPLQAYQLSLAAPVPPPGTFDAAAARRGGALFAGRARCATCHVPPQMTEPGFNTHAPEEIGIDGFQASRSPDGRYRTTPLPGLFARAKGGFYHDGRFPTLLDVVNHYDTFQRLGLSAAEKTDLVEYLKSL